MRILITNTADLAFSMDLPSMDGDPVRVLIPGHSFVDIGALIIPEELNRVRAFLPPGALVQFVRESDDLIGVPPVYDVPSRAAVRLASTGNLPLSGLGAVDGVVPSPGDSILAKDQIDGTANGLYLAAAGPWTRRLDANASSALQTGMQVLAWDSGGSQAGTIFYLSTPPPLVLGSTALTFDAIAGGGGGGAPPYTLAAAAVGVAGAAGAINQYARGDHVHSIGTVADGEVVRRVGAALSGIGINTAGGLAALDAGSLRLATSIIGALANVFDIGDGAAGAKVLRLRNGFNLDLSGNPTANRVLTLPDATTTLESQNNRDTANGYAGLDANVRLNTAVIGAGANAFSVGDGAAGAKLLRLRNGFDMDLSGNPTANRVLTLPDATTTLESQNNKDAASGYPGLDANLRLNSAVIGVLANTFDIGSGGAGAKILRLRNAFTMDLSGNPTANRVLTLPDATTTLESQNNKDVASGYAGIDANLRLDTAVIGTARDAFNIAVNTTPAVPSTPASNFLSLGGIEWVPGWRDLLFMDQSGFAYFIQRAMPWSHRLDWQAVQIGTTLPAEGMIMATVGTITTPALANDQLSYRPRQRSTSAAAINSYATFFTGAGGTGLGVVRPGAVVSSTNIGGWFTTQTIAFGNDVAGTSMFVGCGQAVAGGTTTPVDRAHHIGISFEVGSATGSAIRVTRNDGSASGVAVAITLGNPGVVASLNRGASTFPLVVTTFEPPGGGLAGIRVDGIQGPQTIVPYFRDSFTTQIPSSGLTGGEVYEHYQRTHAGTTAVIMDAYSMQGWSGG